MNNRQRMHATNSKIKKHLLELGFHSIYMFPHMRFMKDYVLKTCNFDAMGYKDGFKKTCLFQFKTNCNPPSGLLDKYKELEEQYHIKCYWINCSKKGIIIYSN